MTILTSTGELLEFSKQKYINGCEIESVDAKLLKSFISYDPLKKYYLILTASQLIVVLRQKEMKIFKTFEDVIDIQVKDHLSLGRPQIIMKIRDQEDPYITDLVGTLKVSETKVQSQINLNLHSKLQETVVRLEKAKQLLQEKKTCRINSWLQFTQQTGESSITSGIVQTNNLDHIPTSKIEILPTWQKLFCRRWILGIPIKNVSKSKIYDIGAILQHSEEKSFQCKKQLFVFPENKEPGMSWTQIPEKKAIFQPSEVLTVQSSGVVVCCLEEPKFTNSRSVKLSGVLTFKEENDDSRNIQQIRFFPVELKVSDLVRNKFKSFATTNSEESYIDLLSCVVVCKCTKLEINLLHPSATQFEEVLKKDLGFVRVPSIDHYICTLNGPLQDVIVKIDHHSPEQYLLSVHTSDEKTTTLFSHSLQDILPENTKVSEYKGPVPTIKDCLNSLDAELLLVLNTLSTYNKKTLPLSDNDVIEIPESAYRDFQKKLFKQESITEKLFRSLPPEK